MGILSEAAELARQRLGEEFESLSLTRVAVGLFFTGVRLSNGSAGVCFTPVKEIPQAVCCPSSAGRIFHPMKVRGLRLVDALSALNSREPLKTAVAIASLNALSATCWERGFTGGFSMKIGMDAQDAVRMPDGSSVAVVGALVPLLRALKRRGGPWWVIEQDPRTLKDDEMPHYVPWELSGEIVGQADVLIVTGVTLVNHTLEQILASARPGAEIAVMGPTASLLPEPLFHRGVRVVGGVLVRKPDQLLDVLAAGGSGYHFFDTLGSRMVIERGD
jgi:uncharacterized protein (DUF4213/DUF364 family)